MRKAQAVHVVREAAQMLLEDFRHVGTAVAAMGDHIFQLQVGIQIALFIPDKVFNLLDNLFLTLFNRGLSRRFLCHFFHRFFRFDDDGLAAPCGKPNRFELVVKTNFKQYKEVFSRGGDSDGFAFISNGEILIDGEGTLQVIDATGRVIHSGDAINRVSTSGMTPGVYVLRLIDGDTIRTQKIVID